MHIAKTRPDLAGEFHRIFFVTGNLQQYTPQTAASL